MRRMVLVALLALPTVASGQALPPAVDPILPFRTDPPDAEWLVSSWPAGQTQIAVWAPGNVRPLPEKGALELRLDENPGGERPFQGAEFQSRAHADQGRWAWYATAPEMAEGAVFGMFLYRADHEHDPWREYDFEFVGSDTTKVEINIHFEDADGRHVTLADAEESPVVIDLGFDAAKGPHLYEIVVSEKHAVFRIDGEVVGEYGPRDMPRGTWSSGSLRSFVDLWPVSTAQHAWAGAWTYPGKALTALIYGTAVPQSASPDVPRRAAK